MKAVQANVVNPVKFCFKIARIVDNGTWRLNKIVVMWTQIAFGILTIFQQSAAFTVLTVIDIYTASRTQVLVSS